MAHPISEDCLQRFARGKATREERRKILVHLLRGCSECSLLLQAYAEPAVQRSDFEGVLDPSTRRLLSGLDGPAPRRTRRPSPIISH